MKIKNKIKLIIITLLFKLQLDGISIKIIISDGTTDKNQKFWVGGKYEIKLNQIPYKIYEKINMQLSNKKNAEIIKNYIIMKSSGKECLIAYIKNIHSIFCFHIYNTPKILFKEKNPLKIETYSIKKLSLYKADYPEKYIKFQTDHPDIIKIDNQGIIKAIRPGRAIIKVSGFDNKTTKLKVISISNNGFLRNESLNRLNNINYKNIMIVAHPDDESIWGGAHIFKEKYFIVCLTNGYNYVRVNSFKELLNFTDNEGIILNYPDTQDYIRDNWYEVENGILKDIFILLNYKPWQKIVTHGPDGNYGHYHHLKTCEFVTKIAKFLNKSNNLYYFGKYFRKKKIPKFLKRIGDKELKYKNKEISFYKREKEGIFKCFSHIIPFENFILASEWKKKI